MLPQENWPNFNQFSTIRPWSKGTHDCANKSSYPLPRKKNQISENPLTT